MKYKALYRVYRPKNFSEVVGQTHITKTLENTISENKISHAYLFTGPRGTGKTSIAKIFAKSINCEKETWPCNECDNCQSVNNGTSLDVIEIDAASNNGVDEIRELREMVKYAPTSGKFKVYIIDEVHMLTTQAFNALLKTLEEPPEHVVFILATTEPHKIPETILSRCQRYNFQRVSKSDIKNNMENILDKEGVKFDESATTLISELADGGVRDSLSILEQCIAHTTTTLDENIVNTIFGIASKDDKIKLINYISKSDITNALNLSASFSESGTDLNRVVLDIIEIIKDAVIIDNTGTDANTKLSKSDRDKFAMTKDPFEIIEVLIGTIANFKLSNDKKNYFDLAILKLCETKVVSNVEVKIIEEATPVVEEVVAKVVIEEPVIEEVKVEPIIEEPIIEEVKVEEVKVEEVVEEVPAPKKDLESTMVLQGIFEEQKAELKKETTPQADVSFDEVENILVQASRVTRDEFISKWSLLRRYLANQNSAKAASILVDGVVGAACKDAAVIVFKHKDSADILNARNNDGFLVSFINQLLGEPILLIGISESEWVDSKNKYMQKRQINKLPQAVKIARPQVDTSTIEKIEEPEHIKFAKDIFG